MVQLDDPDLEVVERIVRGETGLYESLVKRYNQRLFRVARAFLHEDSGVEDVMQEAYLRAFVALPGFKGDALFSTWLTRILINCALSYLRSRKRRREVALEEVDAVDSGGDELKKVMQEQLGHLIEKAVDGLPTRYRVVFAMRELSDMSVAETASSLGISHENTKVRLHRARKLLRRELQRQMPDIGLYTFLGDRCDALTRRVMERIRSGDLSPAPADAEVVHEARPEMRAGKQG